MKVMLLWNRKCKMYVRGYTFDDLDSLSKYIISCWQLPFDFDDRIIYRRKTFQLNFNQPALQTIDNLVHSAASDYSYFTILNQLLDSEGVLLEIQIVDIGR